MIRGRKPVPTALKLIRGNPGRRPISPHEPTPEALDEHVAPPAWLDKPARAEWRRVAPLLARAGLLTVLDVDALAAYCKAASDWHTANAQIKKFGMVTTSPNGYAMPSPYLRISERAWQTMRHLLADFGMSPAARTRVTRATPPAAVDPLNRFLKR